MDGLARKFTLPGKLQKYSKNRNLLQGVFLLFWWFVWFWGFFDFFFACRYPK